MSQLNLKRTMDRIEVATESSPIAVFKSEEEGCVESFFANTVITQAKIRRGDESLIGVFHGAMNSASVKSTIATAMQGALEAAV